MFADRASREVMRWCAEWCDPNGDPAGARGGKFWPVSDVKMRSGRFAVKTLKMRSGAYGAVLSAALKDVMKSHSILDFPHSSS